MLVFLVALLIVVGLSEEEAATPVAVQAATPTPAPLSTDVRREAVKAGFDGIADRLDEAALPTVILQPGGRGQSRLGGPADLPAGASWPRCQGKPMSFLGQIRLFELPASADELRRHGGTLLFFTNVEFEPGDEQYGLWAGDCTTVLHAEKGAPTRRATSLDPGVLRLKATPLRFTTRRDIPDTALDDKLYPPLHDVTVTDWERYLTLREGLLGNPELEHRLLGYMTEPNGGDECSERAERRRDTWRHLFTLGWDEELGWEIADGGRLQVLISPQDLRAGRFDRVCGIFDSG